MFGPLAEHAKVFAYNRPGIGGSEKPKVPQVGSHMVGSLRTTLQAANCWQPYISVGHSLGGLIVNLFACLHPSEVSAVVLIEATAPGDIFVLTENENGLQRFLRFILEKRAPPNPHEESQQVHATVVELKLAPLFPAVPLTVITGGKPAMAWATAPKALAAREASQKGLVSLSALGKQTIAPLSGHFPQFTEPHLVVAAITEAANSPFKPNPLRGSE